MDLESYDNITSIHRKESLESYELRTLENEMREIVRLNQKLEDSCRVLYEENSRERENLSSLGSFARLREENAGLKMKL